MLPALRSLCCLIVVATTCPTFADESAKPHPTKPQFPGPSAEGFLLPNGWRLTPAGEHVLLTDLPLNILTSPDGKYAFVATSGYNAHELSVIELASKTKIAVQ